MAANVAGLWPQIPVHASATHGQENFAIATGPIGVDIEAVYILDYLTGELKAAVLNLQTGKFMSFFEHNITKELPVGTGKNPHYLMVTGMCDMAQGGTGPVGQFRCLCGGIHERPDHGLRLALDGVCAQALEPFKGQFIPLDGIKFRAAAIRN